MIAAAAASGGVLTAQTKPSAAAAAAPAPAARTRLAVIVTSPFAVNAFWTRHLAAMRHAYDITVLVNATDARLQGVVTLLPEGVRLVPINLVRPINPVYDIAVLWAIGRHLRRERVQIAISMTPKGGLVGMLAAWGTSVPVRIHWFTGQVWATRGGFMRQLLKTTDTITAACATAAFVDSQTQADFLATQGIADRQKLEVLGSGSVSGVDCERFAPNANVRREVRAQLGLAEGEVVLVFAGRINRDKGVPELIDAHGRLRAAGHRIRLLLVGPDEGQLLAQDLPEGVVAVGYTQTVERYFQAADIFCLPSHREGFGQVLIEAGACGLPSVASRIYGITDALLDGVTGLLHTPADAADLFAKIERLVVSPDLRQKLGSAALERARCEFSSARLTALLMARLDGLLNKPD